jgi:uncharacterized protein YbjQ (UPF0145 family)
MIVTTTSNIEGKKIVEYKGNADGLLLQNHVVVE